MVAELVLDRSSDQSFFIDRPVSELQWNSFVRAPRGTLNVLTQVREDFENIDVLANSIARKGLFHPIIAAYLDEEHCLGYLEKHNRRWGTETQISDLVSVRGEEGKYYCIIAAGGRRNAAIQFLETVGCSSCNEQYGEGDCYYRHVPDGLVMVSLRPNITFDEGFEIQMHENTHMEVASQREAKVMAAYFHSRREEDPGYKPANVARELGRSESFVRRALKYVEVPKQIQDAVEAKTIPYSVACEISRLNGLVSDMDQLRWAVKWSTKKYKSVDAFAKEISREIFDMKGGQTTMIDLLFTEDQQKTMAEAQRRAVLKSTVDGLSETTEHLKKIGGLFKAEVIDKGGSPYIEKLTVDAHLKTIGLVMPWLGHLTQLAGELRSRGQEDKAEEIVNALGLAQKTESLLLALQQGQPRNNGHEFKNHSLFAG